MTNGGISWHDLSARRRDILVEVAAIERSGGAPTGVAIREALEERGHDLGAKSVYVNLDHLEERGLVSKGIVDGRTNRYELTGTARSLMEWHVDRMARQLGQEVREPGAIVRSSPGGGLGVE